MIVTTTFNSLESLRDNRQAFDYVFLSSVFNSHAYYHKNEEAGINMLRSIVSKSICPVYALGGVSTEKLPTVEVAGFKGAGLSSAVWKDFDRQSKQLSNLIHAA
jgi:thiamine monophosphate synthase